jgi:hypothetical protein
MMTSPRFTDSVRSTSSEPWDTVSSTATTVSPTPITLRRDSGSWSQAALARATITGAAAPMIPALTGLVERTPQYHAVVLPTRPASERVTKVT